MRPLGQRVLCRLVRLASAAFPRDFKRSLGDDLLDTVDDLYRHRSTSPSTRFPTLGLFLTVPLSLLRAGLAERCRELAALWQRPDTARRPLSSRIDTMLQDFRYAIRTLTARPGFTLLATLTLAIGIGASVAMFTVVDGVLLEPLPFPRSEELVDVYRYDSDEGRDVRKGFSLPDLHDLQKQATGLESSFGYWGATFDLTGLGDAEVISGARVSGPFLATLGLGPELGRDFVPEEAIFGAAPTVVISRRFWQERLGGRPEAVGETLEIDGEPHTIVGVAPEGLDFPYGSEAWIPVQLDVEFCGRGCHFLEVLGRIAPGTGLETLERDLLLIAERLEAAHPESNALKRFTAMPFHDFIVGPVRPALTALSGGVLLVLLIAAANVAHLLLARGAGRRRELAVRAAVGAGRGRLFRQLLIEGALLAVLGAGAGLALCAGLLRSVLAFAPSDLPRLDEVAIDGGVIGFAVLAAAFVLVVFGVLPAWRLSRSSLRSRLGMDSPGTPRARGLLLATEVALSLVLLLGAGLLLRSFGNLLNTELGFTRERISTFTVSLPETRYDTPERIVSLFERFEEQLVSLPGVDQVAGTFASPFGRVNISSSVTPLDRPQPPPSQRLGAQINVATPGLFEALEVPLLEGRDFTTNDRAGSPWVAVVNRTFAERYYPGRSAIGETLRVGASFNREPGDEEVYTIVGVVGDLRSQLTGSAQPELWFAQAQSASDLLTLVVRSAPGSEVVPAARQALSALDPNLPLRWVETLDAAVDRALGPSRFYLMLFAAFAAIAVLMAAAGLYGVVSFLVSQRTRELAVRMALGADRGRLVRMVLRESMGPVGVGVVLGVLAALAFSRALLSLLHGVTPHDFSTYVVATLLLVAVSLLATLAPARRATTVSPTEALKEE